MEGYQIAAWIRLGTVLLNNVVATLPAGDGTMGAETADRFEMPFTFCHGNVCVANVTLSQVEFEAILNKRVFRLRWWVTVKGMLTNAGFYRYLTRWHKGSTIVRATSLAPFYRKFDFAARSSHDIRGSGRKDRDDSR